MENQYELPHCRYFIFNTSRFRIWIQLELDPKVHVILYLQAFGQVYRLISLCVSNKLLLAIIILFFGNILLLFKSLQFQILRLLFFFFFLFCRLPVSSSFRTLSFFLFSTSLNVHSVFFSLPFGPVLI